MSFDIEISKDGYKILRIDKDDKKTYLGSKYNQKREIDKFINNLGEFTNRDNFIVLGLSLGEHIKELIKILHKECKILIVEFNENLIEYCKSNEEIKKNIDNERIIIANNKEETENFLKMYINELNIDKLKISAYSSYDKIYAEKSKEIYLLARNFLAKTKIIRNTFKVFGEVFLDNSLANLKYIAKSTEINELENSYRNKPAIIVSAGPSLEKNIDKLKGIDKALIFTGGRTLGSLLERNIIPTCVGVIDPGEPAYHQVAPYIEKVEFPLVFTDLTNEKIVKAHNGEKIFYTDSLFISKVWNKNIKCLYGGGSIAHTLTNLALYIGCNPIIFIGQDFAYTEEHGHASFCSYKTFDEYKDASDIYVKDIHGEKIRTSVLLNEYRLRLEEIIKENHDIKFINATEGGANIEGTENRRLEDVLNELKKEEIIPIKNFLKFSDKTQDIVKELQYNLDLTKKYIKLCQNAKRYLKNYKSSYYLKNQKGVDDSLKKLDKIDKEIMKKNLEIGLISTIVTKIIYEVENDEQFMIQSLDNKDVAFNKELSRSDAMYSKLESAARLCCKKIEVTINKLKEEC